MKRTRRYSVAAAGILVALCCAAGCYERVVGAEGLGASYANVQPSYRSETAADRAWDSLVSPPKPPSRSERWVDPGSRDSLNK